MAITTWILVRVRGEYASVTPYSTKDEVRTEFNRIYDEAVATYRPMDGFFVEREGNDVFTVKYKDVQIERVDWRALEIK